MTTEQLAEIAAIELGEPVLAVEPLAGDASTRRFFRVRLRTRRPVVAMVFEGRLDPHSHPQLLVGQFLESLGFPIPSLAAARPEAGVLFYDDLGDRLLQDVVRGPEVRSDAQIEPSAEIQRLYRDAVGLIVDLQTRGTPELPAGHPSLTSALDEERFLFELHFFREHYLEGLRGLRLGPREIDTLEQFLRTLARKASAHPWVLCHRDFHSRNLLVHEDRIRLIDFQDARMGPLAYDLASLLRDSYVVLPADLRESLLSDYLEKRRGLVPDPDRFRHDFDVVALQRNLKAIGTFGYQAAVRGKRDYLAFIAPTWDYIFDTLGRLPAFAGVLPILEVARQPE